MYVIISISCWYHGMYMFLFILSLLMFHFLSSSSLSFYSYKQQKFNLCREENEGFSKLISKPKTIFN